MCVCVCFVKDASSLSPQTDFYKKMALDCAGLHIAVDLVMFNSLCADMATLCTYIYIYD